MTPNNAQAKQVAITYGSDWEMTPRNPCTYWFQARVDRVHVDGLNRTKDDVIRNTVDELFHATDFEDVILRAHKVSISMLSQ